MQSSVVSVLIRDRLLDLSASSLLCRKRAQDAIRARIPALHGSGAGSLACLASEQETSLAFQLEQAKLLSLSCSPASQQEQPCFSAGAAGSPCRRLA